MQLAFNEKKATQAAARFLQLAGGRMNYMKLIKLLYLADRDALLRWGRPISRDKYFSMKYGPVLSEVHDLITEEPAPGTESYWSRYISAPANREIALTQLAEDDELSLAEEKLIDEVFAAYGGYQPFDLVDLLHKSLPEWKEVQTGRVPIDYREILRAGGKTPQEIEVIEAELADISLAESVLSPAPPRPTR